MARASLSETILGITSPAFDMLEEIFVAATIGGIILKAWHEVSMNSPSISTYLKELRWLTINSSSLQTVTTFPFHDLPPELKKISQKVFPVLFTLSFIWGQLPDIPFKADKFGLGFTIKAQKEIKRARMGKPPLCIENHEVNIVEDSDDECAFEEWIYPTVGGKLNNWHAKDFTPISFNEE